MEAYYLRQRKFGAELHLLPHNAQVALYLCEFSSEFRFLILIAPCWMEAPCLPTVLNMLKDIPHWCLVVNSHQGCFG